MRKTGKNFTRQPALLVISPGGLGLHYHGPAISLYRLLSMMKDRLTVDVIHGSAEQGDIAPLRGQAIRTGTASPDLRRSLSFIFLASWYVLRNRKRYDTVVLATSSLLTLVPGALASLLGLRVISRAAAISEVSTQAGGRLGAAIKRYLLGEASAYLAISQAIARALRDSLGEKACIYLIPNGVDLARFVPVERSVANRVASELGLDPRSRLRIVCVGAIGDRKGQLHIVDALTRLPNDISLLLVGPIREPAYFEEIERVIQAGKLESRVSYIPFIEEVEKAYRAGDLFVLPSLGEGMPNAMLEAMASGLVPLGTQISGIEDLISDGCGRFVTRDGSSIAEAARHYINQPNVLAAESQRARAVIEDTYGAEAISEKFYTLTCTKRDSEQ